MEQLNNKIGLVGHGYWGKILHSNISKLYGENISVYDSIQGIGSFDEIKTCDKVFVATPTRTHYEMVLPLLENGIDVFCEKPLSPSLRECELLYQTANANSSKLFVDWVFTFNDAVNHIKKLYHSGKLGGLRNVTMNRLNSGPERKDVSAKWDLASHDVSILHYIANWSDNCDVLPINVNWNCYRRNPASFVADTCVGSIRYETFDAIIHSSWEYGRKDRKCIFEFDAGFLEWDDTKNSITLNGKPETFTKLGSPLENSIKTFVEGDFHKQIDLTLTVTETLEHGE